ncbi:class I SAM-dependent DNA methyltransferase [Allorhizocola rhizosphaerae]|uniref:class I SAM-dependent DNA methyltransferase n=1 Tax=Allorhizocola rhizosphaerae TaxID=1872709 RepID=UPI0013C2B7B9|nr:class I SAM-dependent methyltransferase [Allorhizocola rhizosphaerae]
MEGFSASLYGDAIADYYDEFFVPEAHSVYGRSETLDSADFLAKHALGGSAFEVGVGTGRVALALAERGVDVMGIEVSARMIARLRTKPGGKRLRVIQGDFLIEPVEERFGLVFAVFNLLVAFTTQEDQVTFFRKAARCLAPDGVLIVENAMPQRGRSEPSGLLLRRMAQDHVLASAYTFDVATQRVEMQHILVQQDGLKLFPVHGRHVWPSEMDLMARLAGLRLDYRSGGWRGEPFTADSMRHISVYRLDG